MPTGLMLFDVVEVLGNLIQANVTDLNPSRPKNKWVFPQMPDDDTNLPEVVVKLGQPNYERDSAGNYLKSEYIEPVVANIPLGITAQPGKFVEYYYKKATVDIKLIVLTQKAMNESVAVTFNNSVLNLKNQPLNIYLTEQIKHMIWKKRSDILVYFDDFNLGTIETTFDNNKWSWGSIINCEIRYKDCFVNEYIDGVLVKSYSLNQAISV